ncbi:MAG: BTAD domain-containing putative transcriptional regulator, partial [Actinomycetota bacterium]
MKIDGSVLGRIGLRVEDRVVSVGGHRQRRLLGVLLLRAGQTVPSAELIEAVWNGTPPPSADNTFRSYVARLRRSLDAAGATGTEVVVTEPSGYSICGSVEVDSARFEHQLETARRRLELGDLAAARRNLDDALSSWTGPPFAEFAVEEWARVEAVRLDELHTAARELSVQIDLEDNQPEAAIVEARRLTEHHPFRDRPHRLLMSALYRDGRHADALRVARDHRRRLRDEAGLEPSPELVDLEQRVLQHDPSLVRRASRHVRGHVLGDVLRSTPDAAIHSARRASESHREIPGEDGGAAELMLIAFTERVADDPEFIRCFDLDARRRSSLRHPSLAPWHDSWREPGVAYVVASAPTDGLLNPLARSDAQSAPSLDVIQRIVVDLGDALSTLHGADLSHGEFHAADIWLDGDRPVLLGPVAGLGRPARPEIDVASLASVLVSLNGRLLDAGPASNDTEAAKRL